MFNVLVMISEGVSGELLSAIGTPFPDKTNCPLEQTMVCFSIFISM